MIEVSFSYFGNLSAPFVLSAIPDIGEKVTVNGWIDTEPAFVGYVKRREFELWQSGKCSVVISLEKCK